MQDKRRPGFAFVVTIVKPVLLATTTHDWIDGDKLPATGGCVVVLNHVSHVDPLTAAHLVYDHGRVPHYLAKSGLFENRVLGFLMRAAGQIPVERASANAAGAFSAAVEAVREGKVVVVYPEGTITRDPGLWPMTGKSGAARIALETGCPVVPVGQWGAHQILYPYASKPDLFPRKLIRMKVGDPVDLADLSGRPRDHHVIQEATDRIMTSITGLVEDVRGEQAPTERFDMRRAGLRPASTPDNPDNPDKKEQP